MNFRMSEKNKGHTINLAIDVGNTYVKMGVFDNNELLDNVFFKGSLTDQGKTFIKKYQINRAILCKVNNIDPDFMGWLKNTIETLVEFNENTPLPLKNLYKTPSTLGKDRLAAVVGAHTIFPQKNVLVIDTGSAITFDFLNSRGEFSGGNISPGLEMRFRALNEFTSSLPRQSKSEQFPVFGYDSGSAIISGVQKGIIFEIDGYIDELTAKFPNLIIIMTGGDAYFFEKKLKNTIFVVPNLVLIGLNHILHYNEK